VSIIEQAVNQHRAGTARQAIHSNSAKVVADFPGASEDSADAPCHHIRLSRLRKFGMVTPDGARTAVAEEFRAIKRPLIEQRHNGSNGNLIMVTSALPGEGKTYCAINLAMSMAMEMDHTVLLVDADVTRPSVPDRLGLVAGAGLLDLLGGSPLALADVLMRTSIDGLSILPAGTASGHANELLASQAMTTLLQEIAQRYPDRIVIFDSPPVLLATESRVLARQMGQIVFVVEAETTTQAAVSHALTQLDGCPHVNLLFNKSTAFLGGEQYGSYY
jgi:protein-tyrosine kinase